MIHGGLAVVLVVAVVAVAYGAQAPSLGVAEFAPAARQAVEAPPTTGADDGNRAGGKGGRRPTTTTLPVTTSTLSSTDATSAAAPTTKVGRARLCYGMPPRQAEDPQSPPCVATMFDGDNGGATARGVTGTEIAIAVPGSSSYFTAHYPLLFDYFNQTYEFYGRRLKPVYVPLGNSDPAGLRALGAQIGAANVFGAVDYIANLNPALHQELARQKVITTTVGYENLLTDRTSFDPLDPYLWSVYPSLEQTWRNLADLACTALVGRPPRHADLGASTPATRKFGIVASGRDAIPWTGPLVDALTACGAEPVVVSTDQAKDDGTVLRTGLQALENAGVTTAVCACWRRAFTSVVRAANDSLDYRPEWLLPAFGYSAEYEEYAVQGLPPALRKLIFGLVPTPRLIPLQGQPWYHLQAQVGNNDPIAMESAYRMMLILAAGIQAAGPNLTPETFAAGLMSTQFPNPGAGAEPYWQPSVGFGPGDHSFFNDYALAWWSDTAPGWGTLSKAAGGSWCYLDGGARYTVGHFPADADSRFFQADERCR